MYRWCLLGGVAAMLAGCDGSMPDTGGAAAATASAAVEQPTLMNIDQIGMENGRGLYVARRDTGEVRIPFDVPTARVDPVRRHDMEQVGQTPGGVVVVLDRYASRAAAGGRCADGRESFVRAFSLASRREVLVRPVESCLDGVKAGDPAVRWSGDGRFTVTGGAPATFVIAGDTIGLENKRG